MLHGSGLGNICIRRKRTLGFDTANGIDLAGLRQASGGDAGSAMKFDRGLELALDDGEPVGQLFGRHIEKKQGLVIASGPRPVTVLFD
ncbi:hypothetical protein D3C86_1313080 [compost metagenome]